MRAAHLNASLEARECRSVRRDTRSAGHHPCSCQSGQALVEFALVLPVFLLLLVGIVDFGRGYSAWNTIQNGAREGARLAAVNPDEDAIRTRVLQTSSSLDGSKLMVTIMCSPSGGTSFTTCPEASAWAEGDIVRVQVDYRYTYLTPVLPRLGGLGDTLTETATAEARFEGQ
jgi:Flp pilus assembly protein TadG